MENQVTTNPVGMVTQPSLPPGKEMEWSVDNGVLTVRIDLLKTADEGIKHSKMPWGSTGFKMIEPILKKLSLKRDYDLIKDLP